MQNQQQMQSSGHTAQSVNLNNSSITKSQYSAASNKNRGGDSASAGGGLYQPKFTKRSLEKAHVTMSQFSVAKPMARRMSSHEFKNSQTPVAEREQDSQAAEGYYMKNASMIQALA